MKKRKPSKATICKRTVRQSYEPATRRMRNDCQRIEATIRVMAEYEEYGDSLNFLRIN